MAEKTFDHTVPVLVDGQGKPNPFVRVSVNEPAFQESRLQELVEDHPEVLPLADLDLMFSPAVCIGREIQTLSGNIDNLFISPTGGITLVETKLWKNPQARREVVAQIIDYARHLATWSFGDLEERVTSYLARKHGWTGNLYDWLSKDPRFDELDDEAAFRDRVSGNIQKGRFLLLIVGDGIQRNVEEMVSYLQLTPQLQYNLALVRLACYRPVGQEGPLLFVPSIVTKTREVERAVVRLELSDQAKQLVTPIIEVPTGETTVTPGEKAFYDELRKSIGEALTEQTRSFVKALESEPSVEVARQKRLIPKLFFEAADGSQQWVWLFVLSSSGSICVGGYGKWKSEIIPRPIVEEFWADVGRYCPTIQPKISGDEAKVPTVSLGEFLPHADAVLEGTRRYIANVQNISSD